MPRWQRQSKFKKYVKNVYLRTAANKNDKVINMSSNNTDLSASAFFGGLPRNRNLWEGISGISSGLTVEKNSSVSSSFLHSQITTMPGRGMV